MVCVVFTSGDGEIGGESLVDETRGGETRWVAERKGRSRGFYEIRMYVLGLITIFQNKVLEEGIGGERRRA